MAIRKKKIVGYIGKNHNLNDVFDIRTYYEQTGVRRKIEIDSLWDKGKKEQWIDDYPPKKVTITIEVESGK